MNGEFSRYDDKLEIMLQDASSKPHYVRLEYLRNITNNFSDERLLGQGGFGTVYKGVLQDGKTIAVKKLNSSIPGVKDKQFENEANHLMRLKHQNIVQLVGWCFETENIYVEYNGKYICAEKSERLLCLEYMPKGNLRGYLSDEFSGLGWDTRYKIIKGICYGLRHLHEEWQRNAPIVHMDLKPANILLDDNMVPKIADFGMSRLFSEEKTWTRTISRDGTLGYMSPEYINRGLISKKSDIFSLGVIIIEIVTGGRDYPDEDDTGISSEEFIEMVLHNWSQRKGIKSLFGMSPEVDYQQIRRCIQIGLDCVKNDRFKRPTISQIIKAFHGPGSADSSNIKWGIPVPEQMDVPAPSPSSQPANTAQPAQASIILSRPNAILLDCFLQSLPFASDAGAGNFDVLRNNAHFRNLLGSVQAHPQIWQPLLQELGKQNPQVMQLIQENHVEVLQLINEQKPLEGHEENEMNRLNLPIKKRNRLDQTDAAETIALTPEENEAIIGLERMGMGFERALVLEVFFGVNYLLELKHGVTGSSQGATDPGGAEVNKRSRRPSAKVYGSDWV